jgi:L-aminopeptidase/D-esterase-like protein
MAGFRVGHWTDYEAKTGCTVVLFDSLVPAVVDVRGGAPATRETDLLAADRMVGKVDAILLTGGSAFGLSAADGVMQFLRDQGRGWPTAVMPVPIVAAAALFDLGVGSPVWPGPEAGFAACGGAVAPDEIAVGAVGAGTGATVRKLWPNRPALPGGIGYASEGLPDGSTIHALVAVNAVGEIVAGDQADVPRRELLTTSEEMPTEREATTRGVVIVDGTSTARALRRVAVAAHDGYARAIVPAHTTFDGDIVLACATGGLAEDRLEREVMLCIAAELAVERAIRSAVSG